MLVLASIVPSFAPLSPSVRGRTELSRSCAVRRAPPLRLQLLDPPPDDAGDDGDGEEQETSSEEVDAFRAQLLRQFGGGSTEADVTEEEEEATPPELVDEALDDSRARLMRQFDGGGVYEEPKPDESGSTPTARESGHPTAGAVLVANPQRFCSRNPFGRAVKDLNRFGLQGPVSGDLSPDTKAQMLPVLLLLEHGEEGSTGLLLERRTGALMGDISMDEYGCVAISPLWLGGTENQNSLYCVHDVPDIGGANEIGDGLFVGGWEAARPKVSDRSLADSHFKFFLGVTQWARGQLKEEIEAGAWLVLDCEPDLVIKDRVAGWQPGRPKPVWMELVRALGEDYDTLYKLVYPDDD